MINCVRFADLERHLATLGFRRTGQTKSTALFQRGADEVFTIRLPNANGDLPENLMNDALDNAGLPVPAWQTHWCD